MFAFQFAFINELMSFECEERGAKKRFCGKQTQVFSSINAFEFDARKCNNLSLHKLRFYQIFPPVCGWTVGQPRQLWIFVEFFIASLIKKES